MNQLDASLGVIEELLAVQSQDSKKNIYLITLNTFRESAAAAQSSKELMKKFNDLCERIQKEDQINKHDLTNITFNKQPNTDNSARPREEKKKSDQSKRVFESNVALSQRVVGPKTDKDSHVFTEKNTTSKLNNNGDYLSLYQYFRILARYLRKILIFF